MAVEATMLYQILEIIRQSIALGFTHADVKLENLLVAESRVSSRAPQVRLADFGMGCVHCSEGPRGTRFYLPQEAWEGHVGPSMDIWAAGLILHFFVFGAFPDKILRCSPDDLESCISNYKVTESKYFVQLASWERKALAGDVRFMLKLMLEDSWETRIKTFSEVVERAR